jgi:hypothetical protein
VSHQSLFSSIYQRVIFSGKISHRESQKKEKTAGDVAQVIEYLPSKSKFNKEGGEEKKNPPQPVSMEKTKRYLPPPPLFL